MGQIWDVIRSVSEHFGLVSQNALILIWKSPMFVLFMANMTPFKANPYIPSAHTQIMQPLRFSSPSHTSVLRRPQIIFPIELIDYSTETTHLTAENDKS